MENDQKSVKKNDNTLNKTICNKLGFKSENNEEKIMEPILKPNTAQISLISSRGTTNTTSNPKMGSRRIFTPQFKLQVLESYRNDSDCKGNQRATARKYNIHRRQIQKWLQCESSLRSSVANINHNSVKHQFHNVSMQQQQIQKLTITANSYKSNQHSCLDATRSAVSLNTLKVPSQAGVIAPTTQKQGIFEATNLAAVVAAATVAGAAETIAITSTCSTSTSAPTIPLRPSAILSAKRSSTATIPPILTHHHYGVPTYTHISTSVPILAQHLPHPQHIHHQTYQPHQSYQYHNMAYTPTITHQTVKQDSSFLTAVSLPKINVLSAAATPTSSYTVRDIDNADKGIKNCISLQTKACPTFLTEENNHDKSQSNFECTDSPSDIVQTSINLPFSVSSFKNDAYTMVFPFGPMDLSLRHRREVKSDLLTENIKTNCQNIETKQSEKGWISEIDVVDLTYRKRRVHHTPNSSEEYKNDQDMYSKQSKFSNLEILEPNKCFAHNASEICSNDMSNTANCNEEDDIEIEVGTEEKFPPSKPFKLFKPYLLDDYDNIESTSNVNKPTKNDQTESVEKSSKNCCSTKISKSSCYDVSPDGSYQENTFPVTVKENIATSASSSNFLVESRSRSPRSAFSAATAVPTLSPTNFLCPKGSPASSGYESSTSTYSESSLSSRSENYTYGQTYSINLQMQTIYNDNIVTHPSKHVQRWLDKEESKPLRTNSSIALLV